MSKPGTLSMPHRRSVSDWTLGALSALILIISMTMLCASTPQGDQDNSQKKQTPKTTKHERHREEAVREERVWDWLHEEVPYIITDAERATFKKLTMDDEREAFIEDFWERRNPNPVSPENEFKEEYYRRIIYANEQFGSGIPGWKTDRGRIYIMYGPPDEITPFRFGNETYDLNSQPCGTPDHPSEQWRYLHMEGVGENIVLDFVDSNSDGECHLNIDPGLKDTLLLRYPFASPLEPQPPNSPPHVVEVPPYTRIDLYVKAFQPPAVKFKDLKAILPANISANLFPFEVRTDFIRATNQTTFVPITIQIANRDIQLLSKDGVMHGAVDIYGRIAALRGYIAATIEHELVMDVPQQDFETFQSHNTVFQEAALLPPGGYKLNLVLKDNLSGHMGTKELATTVPFLSSGNLTSSSLILADQIRPLLTSPGLVAYPFAIGGRRVRPSVDDKFNSDRPLGIYMQVYNLGIDDKTHKPSLDVRYTVAKDGQGLLDQPEAPSSLAKASQQFTVVKVMRLKDYAPGKYTVQIKVTDNLRKQTISPSVSFEVR